MKRTAQDALNRFALQLDRHAGYGSLRRLAATAYGAALTSMARRRPPVRQCCDILVLHSSAYVSPGKRRLVDRLSGTHGLRTEEYLLNDWSTVIRNRHLCRPEYRVRARFSLKAAQARYLVERYRPRIIMTSTEDIVVPFLKFEANRTGGLLINLAHSLIFDSPSFGMCDFDYYFMYGMSSLRALENNHVRYGATKAVLAGALDLGLYEAPSEGEVSGRCVTYFSTWLPRNMKERYRGQFEEIADFARKNPDCEVTVRLHPLESDAYWKGVAATVGNIRVAPATERIEDTVRRTSITLCPSHSTTPLDSARLGRIPIILDCDGTGATFYEHFSELKRRAGESIAEAIARVTADPARYRSEATRFLNDSLARRTGAIEAVALDIASLCRGEEIADAIAVGGKAGLG